ncbi:hypothetical protein EV421DRAFT_1946358 [Armillaria borealis]|uniref:Uncharacterized protein n=1 Tax=Armillaria borealis TaxID=47425 RepID=A0AA39MDQ0_9AGAR|nr:hypothetical protein EV421DRAFT_1946358 [Armillaria borealis]
MHVIKHAEKRKASDVIIDDELAHSSVEQTDDLTAKSPRLGLGKRGIAIRFVAVINLTDVYYDAKAAPSIVLDIHPYAVLSSVYFQNIFCLRPEQTHSIGVQVALGDTIATSCTETPPVSLPRPNDPTPRKPPLFLHAKCRAIFPPKPRLKVPAAPAKILKRKPPQVEPEVGPTIERKNKDTVKGVVVRCIPTHLLPTTHPEYKEVVNWIWSMLRYGDY